MPETPDNQTELQTETPSPRLPNPLWKWLIAFAVLAAVVIAFALPRIFNSAQNNDIAPQNAASPDTGSTPPVPPDTAPKPKSTTFILFVPNDNALLSLQEVPDASTPGDAPYDVKARRALELLFPRLKFLPPRVKLLSAPKKEKNGVVRVDFSKEFLSLGAQHETPVMLTLDAMARTLGALDSPDGKNLKSAKMQVLINGKTVSTLGQFSLDEPWTASETAPDVPDPKDAV
jgi:hypothetical protein